MKICNKCDNEKKYLNSAIEKIHKNIEVNVYNVVVLNKKNGGIIILKKYNKIRKNIMNKTKKNETYISKTSEKRLLIFD